MPEGSSFDMCTVEFLNKTLPTPRLIPAQYSKTIPKVPIRYKYTLDSKRFVVVSSVSTSVGPFSHYMAITPPTGGVKLPLRVFAYITSSEFGSDVLLLALVCFSEKVDDAVATLSLRLRGRAPRLTSLALLIWRLEAGFDAASACASA